MRLVCPNCDAEYEVDAAAIPDTGRDVQCSNCGHAWFQLSPRVEQEIAAEAALFDAPPAIPDTHEEVAEPPAIQPRALDESVMAVLREEAERETAARRAEAPAIETQSELDLSASIAATVAAANEPASPADPVAQRIAKMKGIDPTPAKPQSRREMLPEIEEINSTLRASSEKRSGDAAAVGMTMETRTGRSAFRSGFVLMLVTGALIAVLYVMAPKLAAQIPAAAPFLESFVALVDSLRLALDNLLKWAIRLMGGASA